MDFIFLDHFRLKRKIEQMVQSIPTVWLHSPMTSSIINLC